MTLVFKQNNQCSEICPLSSFPNFQFNRGFQYLNWRPGQNIRNPSSDIKRPRSISQQRGGGVICLRSWDRSLTQAASWQAPHAVLLLCCTFLVGATLCIVVLHFQRVAQAFRNNNFIFCYIPGPSRLLGLFGHICALLGYGCADPRFH
jgi:hypothetical protein